MADPPQKPDPTTANPAPVRRGISRLGTGLSRLVVVAASVATPVTLLLTLYNTRRDRQHRAYAAQEQLIVELGEALGQGLAGQVQSSAQRYRSLRQAWLQEAMAQLDRGQVPREAATTQSLRDLAGTATPLESLSQSRLLLALDKMGEAPAEAEQKLRQRTLQFLGINRLLGPMGLLSRANLTHLVLAGSDLSCDGLLHSNLAGAHLRNLYAANTDLTATGLFRTRASQAWLLGASLLGSQIVRSDLSGSIANLADLRFARIDRSNFRDAWLQGSSFQGATVRHSHFERADLRGADLRIAGDPQQRRQAFRGARINDHPIGLTGVHLLQLGDRMGRRLPPTRLPAGETAASMGLLVDNGAPLLPSHGPDADGHGEERRAFSFTVDRAQDCRMVQEDQRARPEVAEIFR